MRQESTAPGTGLDRRALIKRAAAVGAAAWTAPVIVGSIASPAGALTLVSCNFYVINVSRSGNSNTLSASVVPSGTCNPTPSGVPQVCSSFVRQNSVSSPVNLTITGASTGGGGSAVTANLSLPAGCNVVGALAGIPATGTPACPPSPVTLGTVTPSSNVNFPAGAVAQNGSVYIFVAVSCS